MRKTSIFNRNLDLSIGYKLFKKTLSIRETKVVWFIQELKTDTWSLSYKVFLASIYTISTPYVFDQTLNTSVCNLKYILNWDQNKIAYLSVYRLCVNWNTVVLLQGFQHFITDLSNEEAVGGCPNHCFRLWTLCHRFVQNLV